MCRTLEVSRSGFYDWARRAPCARDVDDATLAVEIEAIWDASDRTYGSPRVHRWLRRQGFHVSRKRVARIMRHNGWVGESPRRSFKTTTPDKGAAPAPDLVARDFNPTAPNVTWAGDITYVRTWEGWLYLAAVVDCFSRRVVGWSIADHMRAELVVDALQMAVDRRRPAPGLVHHSDQGSQYVSLALGQRCRQAGIELSMGSRGCAYDNAVCESFFKTVKNELVDRRSWPTKAEARHAIFDFIETFYNRRRRHSTLGYLSPAEYEMIATGT
jgi:putative transposase